MAILLTGGTGKTSIRIARLAQDANVPFLLASRKAEAVAPSGLPAVRFDWLDSSTFENAFQYKFPNGESIAAIYLIAPEVSDAAPSMNAFIDFAATEHGVKRFVLMTGSSAEKGGLSVGEVWQHLDDIGVEYCILRVTWFMDNFSGGFFSTSIKEEGKLYSACRDGKIPFVSATDIAAIAFRLLIDKKLHSTNHRVLGPELLTYDQIAAKLSNELGRQIVHVKISEEEKAQFFLKQGLPEFFARFLASLDTQAANGAEERSDDSILRVTGRPPQKFEEWVLENRAVFD